MGSLNLPENLGGVAKAGFTWEEDKGQLCPQVDKVAMFEESFVIPG